MAAIAIVIAICVARALPYSARSHSTGVQHNSIFTPQRPKGTVQSNQDKRISETKAKLVAIAAAQKKVLDEETTGWAEVPGQLDTLLSQEPVDKPAGAQYSKDAARFIVENKLIDTAFVESTCGKTLCKITYQHATTEAFVEYQRYLTFMPWEGASNYFTGEHEQDGSYKSYLWLGRDGFKLPLEEMRRRNATGQYAEEQ